MDNGLLNGIILIYPGKFMFISISNVDFKSYVYEPIVVPDYWWTNGLVFSIQISRVYGNKWLLVLQVTIFSYEPIVSNVPKWLLWFFS